METKTNTIQVSDEAHAAIIGLQHAAGTYDYYRRTLDRMFNTILHASDEFGMDDTETVDTLRAIDSIRQDLAAIAGPIGHRLSSENIAGKVEHTFEDLNDIQDSDYPENAIPAVEA